MKETGNPLIETFDLSDGIQYTELKIPPLATRMNIFILGGFFFSAGLMVGASFIQGVAYLTYGVSTAWLTVVGSLSSLATIYVSIYIGYAGDRMNSPKYGRRKPFVMSGFSVAAVSVVLLCLPPSHKNPLMSAWYLVFAILFSCSYTYMGIPLLSWLYESSASPDDYNKIYLATFTVGFLLGVIFGTVISLIFSPTVTAIVGAIFSFLFLFAVVKYVPSRVVLKSERQPDIVPSFRTCIRTKEFQIVLINRILVQTATGLGGSLLLVTFVVNFARNEKDLGTVILISTIAVIFIGMVFNFITGYLVSKYDKIFIYKLLILLIALISVVAFFTTLNRSSSIGFVALFVIIGSLAFPVGFVDNILVRDLILCDTFLTGLNRQNMYQVAVNVPGSLVSSFFSTIPTVIIYLTGLKTLNYNGDDDSITNYYAWNNNTVWETRIFSTFLVALIAIFGYLSILRYPLTKEVNEKINNALNEKNAKKEALRKRLENSNSNALNDENIDLSRMNEEFAEEFQSIAFDEEHMIMMNFSALEVDAMATSACDSNGNNKALNTIYWYARLGACLGIVNTIVLIVGLIVQLIANSSAVCLLLSVLLLLSSIYSFYEFMRMLKAKALMKEGGNQVALKALASSKKNHAYKDTVQEALRRYDIANDQTTAQDLLLADEFKSMDNEDLQGSYVLYGYRRVLFFFSLSLIFGIICCVL